VKEFGMKIWIYAVLPIMHISDIGLDILYIAKTPMEDKEYYMMLIVFMIFPFFVVLVFSYISAYSYNKGFTGFLLFIFGGLTNTIGPIMKNVFKEDADDQNLMVYIFGLVYVVLEDIP